LHIDGIHGRFAGLALLQHRRHELGILLQLDFDAAVKSPLDGMNKLLLTLRNGCEALFVDLLKLQARVRL
jgi:hypothetical protein